jgi:mRNA interferase MazF
MKRGEVWWAVLPKPMGRRPVVLLSRDEAYHVRTSITVGLVTMTIRNIRTEVRITPENGLLKPSVVNLDDLFTVDKFRLTRFISQLSPEKMAQVNAAIRFALAIP